MPNLIFLIGLPGSGKSSYAKHLVTECPQRLVISTDAIRARLFGGEAIQGPWSQVWQEVECQFQQAVKQILQGEVPLGIYDATNAEERHRREAIALARTSGFSHLTAVWLDTPLQQCLERNQRRDRQVPEQVILQMHQQLLNTPPALDEGFERLIRYTGDGASTEIALFRVRKNRT